MDTVSETHAKKNRLLYQRVVELHTSGNLSYEKIASELNISKSTVGNYIKKWRSGIQVEEIRAPGRQPILKKEDRARIRQVLVENKHVSSKGIANKLKVPSNDAPSCSVTPRTIRRVLSEMDYKHSTPTVQPLLSDIHKQRSVEWCNLHRETDWRQVLFTDETTIELDRCKTKIWHKKESRPVVFKPKHPRKRMFWGGIAYPKTHTCYPSLGRSQVTPTYDFSKTKSCRFCEESACNR